MIYVRYIVPVFTGQEDIMKKVLAMACALAMAGTVAYASPMTDFHTNQGEANLGMWQTKADNSFYKSGKEWNFTGGLTYGVAEGRALQYQYYGLRTDDTNGNSQELNMLYSVHPEVAFYGGYNRIRMTGFGDYGDKTNNVIQFGVVARRPLADGLDIYGKGALGTRNTTIWEAGVNYELDRNLNVNAGYRYLNTKFNSEKNNTYSGFLAGVSYRFGGGNHERDDDWYDSSDDDYVYDEEPSTITRRPANQPIVMVTSEDEEVAASARENDYYFQSVHFASDSDVISPAQKANLDAFVKQAKTTGHVFKLVGHTDSTGNSDYNRTLSQRRVLAVKRYAIDKGVDADKLIEMYKGDQGATESASDRRVDIFEHK